MKKNMNVSLVACLGVVFMFFSGCSKDDSVVQEPKKADVKQLVASQEYKEYAAAMDLLTIKFNESINSLNAEQRDDLFANKNNDEQLKAFIDKFNLQTEVNSVSSKVSRLNELYDMPYIIENKVAEFNEVLKQESAKSTLNHSIMPYESGFSCFLTASNEQNNNRNDLLIDTIMCGINVFCVFYEAMEHADIDRKIAEKLERCLTNS